MSRNTSFEIQILQEKNWVVVEYSTDEGQAKAFADNLLNTGNHAAVRVVRDYLRADGLHAETVVHEKKAAEKKTGDLSLAPITEAPVCRELADFYKAEARQTVGRLCRKYLDEMGVTPTELLHSAAELKRFGDKDRLLFSAIDKVSTLQAQATGEPGKDRRDFLSKMWDQVVLRVRDATGGKKPDSPKTVADVLKVKGDDFNRLVAMSARLLESRSYAGKLDVLVGWSGEDGAAQVMGLIDCFVADIVVSAQMIQDLLGFQPNLASALCQLCDLAEGKAVPAKYAPESFAALNNLFAAGRLPQAREVLLGRVARELGGTNPLSRSEPKLEYEMFHRMAHRLVCHERMLGGPAMAEALVQRSSRVHNTGGSVAVPQALDLLLSALGDNALAVQYLLALAGSPLGESMGGQLDALLDGRVRGAVTMNDWVPVRHAPPARMAALTNANRALREATTLSEESKAALASHVDEVLAKYLLEEGVIEKIDKPDDPLALRAIRLVKFCGSGVLIEGKSLALARARVIDHLRQPQFEEKFLSSVGDPAKAEKHLREFHKLLLETGFR
ncbi:MAG TPA: hypothetical protein VLL76_04415 [Candidatus Omnitrophota bacterium]|nr:hypothetical protein [Candidatus Omnitrophota bacterium]